MLRLRPLPSPRPAAREDRSGRRLRALLAVAALALLALLGACADAGGGRDVLVIGAYTAPREAFQEAVIPAFRAAWKQRTGRDLEVRASYLGSGAQARAVIDGFPADVVVLALESDVDKIARAGLLGAGWRERTGNGGIVGRTLVVIAVRAGNPKRIHDFRDLTRPGLELLVPSPRTSGAAMWTLLALYGAGGTAHGDELVRGVIRNTIILDKGARESIINFERGIGDAAVTYEQEVHVAHRAGRRYDYVMPRSTIVVDLPAAVVDATVDRRGTRAAAEAFVAFLQSAEGQRLLLEYGVRPARGPLAVADPRYPPPGETFTIARFGDWDEVTRRYFGEDGIITRLVAEARR